MKRWCVLIFLVACVSYVTAQVTPGWQTGKVVSFDSHEWTAPASSGDGTQTRLTCRMTLKAGEVTYVLQRDSPREKPPKLTVTSTAKYVFDHDDLIVRDENGREFRMRVVKKGSAVETASAQMSSVEPTVSTIDAANQKTLLEVTANVNGAEIYIDNVLVGRTPAVLSVQKGSHVLTVEQSNYMSWQRAITAAGEKTSFQAELMPQDVVLSEPRGGSVAAAARAAKKQQ